MDQLEQMRVFIRVAEEGGFAAAARVLGLSRSRVSQQIAGLEARLGSRLLNRSTRSISLTATGERYLEHCRHILKMVETADWEAGRNAALPGGQIRLSVPVSFGVRYLGRTLSEFMRRHPEIQLQVGLSDHFVDLVGDGYDLAVRIAELPDSSLVARRIAPCRRILCAAPAYLDQQGRPARPEDLKSHDCLNYSNELRRQDWTIIGPSGSQQIRLEGPLCADNGDLLRQAALDGCGITGLPTFIIGDDIRAGTLEWVLQDYALPPLEIHAVFPSRQHLPVNVRTLVDYLVECFGDNPPWDERLPLRRPRP